MVKKEIGMRVFFHTLASFCTGNEAQPPLRTMPIRQWRLGLALALSKVGHWVS